jgi:TPR repeat protein
MSPEADVGELWSKAISGDAASQVQCGLLLEEGRLVRFDQATAVGFYKLASEQDYALGHAHYARALRLGKSTEKDFQRAGALARKAADAKVPLGQVEYGFCLRQGVGVRSDVNSAARYFKLAADAKFGPGQLNYGLCLERGLGVQIDLAKAASYYKLAADQGLSIAQNNYGLCLQFGKGVKVDLPLAVQYYQMAASQSNASAQVNLGFMLQHGLGVGQDHSLAAQYYESAAHLGDSAGQTNFGSCLEQGIGVSVDLGRAVQYYKAAADQNNIVGLINYGLCLEQGRGIEADPELASQYFKTAADAKSARGLFLWGRCLERKGESHAADYYKQSADLSYSRGEFEYGRCLEDGVGIPVALRQAAHWYLRAAKKQFPGAQEAYDRVMALLGGSGTVTRQRQIRPPRSERVRDYVMDFERLRHVREIGTGRFGAVALLEDPDNGNQYAVKTFMATRAINPDAVAAFEDTVTTLIKLDHGCILPLRGVGLPAAGIGAKVCTDYQKDGSLFDVLTAAKNGKAPAFWTHTKVGIYIISIALGLQYLHSHNEIHGALRPTNLVLDGEGHLKICDFGLYKFVVVGLLKLGMAQAGGAPTYESPDPIGPDFSSKADIFSFGLLIAQMITNSDFLARKAAFLKTQPSTLRATAPELDKRLQVLVTKSLSMDPKARPSIEDMLRVFEEMDYKFFKDVDSQAIKDFIEEFQE